MKMLYTWSLALLCVAQFGYTQTYYATTEVLDPQRPWEASVGTLEEVIYTVRPKGLFTEVGVYLTVSAEHFAYPAGRNLEAVIQFELPEGSIINDSWLWIDTVIIRADIIDRWTASTIYEDIVDRNQDPSVLYKNGPQDYELRIFPLPSDSSRRIKLNMLIPGDWNPDQVGHFLPVNFSRSGWEPPGIQRVQYFPESDFANPQLQNHPENPFVQKTTASGEVFFEYIRDGENFQEQQPIILSDSPMDKGVFLQTFERDEDHFYELALLPDVFLGLEEENGRKVLVLVQHEYLGSQNVDAQDVLDAIHQSLSDNLTDRDSFALMVAGLAPVSVTNGFYPASPDSLDRVFSSLDPSEIGAYNLPVLLSEGLQFALGEPGSDRTKVLLVSNSQSEGSQEQANQLLHDLQQLGADNRLPIYVVNTRDRGVQTIYLSNGSRVYGNDYFFDNLVRIFGGIHRRAFNGNTKQLIAQMGAEVITRIGTFDLYTTLRDGFSFQRYNLRREDALVNLGQPILQSGKYVGNADFYIEAAVKTGGNIFLNGIEIPDSSIRLGNDAVADHWTYSYINQLQPNSQKPEIVQEIIGLSLAERILSEYTAFLCLEPAQGGEPCAECIDDSRDDQTTATDNPLDTLIDLSVFPNPFRSQVTLSIRGTTSRQLGKFEVRVVNAMGQVVQNWPLNDLDSRSELTIPWEGTDLQGQVIPAGIYQILITDGVHQKAWRLIKQ